MLNKWTILFQIKEAKNRRTKLINDRAKEAFKKYVLDCFSLESPLFSRLKENANKVS